MGNPEGKGRGQRNHWKERRGGGKGGRGGKEAGGVVGGVRQWLVSHFLFVYRSQNFLPA